MIVGGSDGFLHSSERADADEPDSRAAAAVSFLLKNAGGAWDGCVLESLATSSPQSIVSHRSSPCFLVLLQWNNIKYDVGRNGPSKSANGRRIVEVEGIQ